MLDLCECAADGYCPRYKQDMTGRFRQICRGENIDLGTAAAFRQQWKLEAGPMATVDQPVRLKLVFDQAAGDAVCATAAIYSLHTAHPGKYITSVESQFPEVFVDNPHVSYQPGGSELRMHYPAIHQSNERGIHFMQGWCEFLGAALGVEVPLLTNRPHLYFKQEPAPPPNDYWIVCAGGKKDFTAKHWPYYQEVVDALSPDIQFAQVGLDQAPLNHVWNFVGQTSLGKLAVLVHGARGVLCGVSLLMHVAAALDKPAVVIAGGREPVQWNAYPRQHYLHTVGELPCCENKACWKSCTERDCQRPVDGSPECMRMIHSEEVADLIRRIESRTQRVTAHEERIASDPGGR